MIEKADNLAIKVAINTYFLSRYHALQANKPLDLSTSVDPKALNSSWVKVETDKRDIEIRIHTDYDIKIIDFNFQLDFKEIEVNNNDATVDLMESSEITYGNNPNHPSSMAGLEHKITLSRINDKWFIVADTYKDDLIQLLRSSTKDEIFTSVNVNHDQIFSEMPVLNKNASQNASVTQNSESIDWYLYDYDNSKAATYADNNYNQAGPAPSTIMDLDGWYSTWPTSYKIYNDPGVSDCTNFFSQAVFEGVSYKASDKNYFYPDPVNYNNWWYYKFSTTADGSLPWITVGGFYDFLTTNYFNYNSWGIGVRGPAGIGTNLCNIKVGDVIFLSNQSVWQHSVIVDQLGANPCNANNVFVAAHSTNYKLRPLSEYSGFYMYPVEIKGYLDEIHLAYLPLTLNSQGTTQMNVQSPIQSPYPAPGETSRRPILPQNGYPAP